MLWALKILVYAHSLFDILYCSVCLTLVVVQHWFCYIGPLGLSLICSISEIYVPVRKNVTLLHSVKNASAWMKQWKCWGWSPRLSDNTSSKGHRGGHISIGQEHTICIPYKDISHLYTIYGYQPHVCRIQYWYSIWLVRMASEWCNVEVMSPCYWLTFPFPSNLPLGVLEWWLMWCEF